MANPVIALAHRDDPYVNQRLQAFNNTTGSLYLRAEDSIRFSTYSGTADIVCTLNGILVTLEGDAVPFQMTNKTDNTSTRKAVQSRIGQGFLLYGAVSLTDTGVAANTVTVVVELMQAMSSSVIALAGSGSPTAQIPVRVTGNGT
jgi:hypothetical protein